MFTIFLLYLYIYHICILYISYIHIYRYTYLYIYTTYTNKLGVSRGIFRFKPVKTTNGANQNTKCGPTKFSHLEVSTNKYSLNKNILCY